MRPLEFFRAHSVFRFDEFTAKHSAAGRSRQSSKAVLKHHVAAGNLLNVRRHVYAVVPSGMTPETAPVDPYLLCSRLAPDAVVAYHAALRLHGRAHSVSRRYSYLCGMRRQPFAFRGDEFVPVLAPAPIRALSDFGGGVRTERRQGLDLRVTSLERTLVDLMAAPQHGGGWEEIWRSLESVEYFDLEAVVSYVEVLGSAIVARRVTSLTPAGCWPGMISTAPSYDSDLSSTAASVARTGAPSASTTSRSGKRMWRAIWCRCCAPTWLRLKLQSRSGQTHSSTNVASGCPTSCR